MGSLKIIFGKQIWLLVSESKLKRNKLWVHQVKEFYNGLMQIWLDANHILIYSTYNEDKSVVAEMLIKTLMAKVS